MKKSHNRHITAALTLLAIAGGAGMFALSVSDARWPGHAYRPAASAANPPASAARITPRRQPDGADMPGDPALALRVDDARTLVVPESSGTAQTRHNDTDIARNGIDAAKAGDFVESDPTGTALNLHMPEQPRTPALARTQTGRLQADKRPPQPERSRLALGTDSNAPPPPKVELFNLFNPDYGLRGFMKQRWINQRVALQGGLGLDDDRIDKSQQKEDDFRDNIAVGMGMILAF